MKHNALTAAVILVIIIVLGYFGFTGSIKRGDVALVDFHVSNENILTFSTTVTTSMGYIRGYKDDGGGVKPHYLDFYSTFGGLNSKFGAKNTFTLELGENDTQIYFRAPNGGYTLVLQKNPETGIWSKPSK